MIRTKRTFGSFSVDDMDAARRFYEDLLGMDVTMVASEGPMFLNGPGGGDFLVYPKPDHSPASFTVLNLSVEDIEETVEDLMSEGVQFQRYEEIPSDERGIHRSQSHSIAWFTDPAGNELSVVQES